MALPAGNLARIGRLSAGRKVGGLLALLTLVLAPATAPATVVQLGFDNITNNSAVDAAIGEAQLVVDVSDEGVGPNEVQFIFRNLGPLASSITQIYFDDGVLPNLVGPPSITNGPGTSYQQGADPSNLPGANQANPDFEATVALSAEPEPPTQPNGVNPNEFVALTFALQGGRTFSDVLNDLESGALRIGIHVQGFASGGSESFVSTPTPTPIPEPGSVILMGLGGTTLLAIRIRRRLSPSARAA